MKSAQTPIFTIGPHAVINRSQAIELLDSLKQDQPLLIEKCCFAIRFFSGDACRYPVQSSGAVVQGGN